ncbi:UDP-perosamine 4-acetyltransferase [Peptoclostridium litorale DSM 5388]|uniref:Sugar O-acyltransferase, sialic acid O-acetyltransferase NeuD family n=1 Tax=Peptoclostridium litorale DSM 5388 TaxID=1121324 RepID=A0A069RKL0_PEPLI|nr:acetyltransferase [Peptoclostridium litorale]KDR94767.1 sugar O-acyltransferase, sialic acid O-acetyltransferase NeuD family [Peptoclostridium litorale DSM 5388]SIN92242.1 UDP-perosamine 4-acetyltransferase [Peptoclostridium litorale DSM 5388]
MSRPKIILIGGGGHCKVIISMLKKLNSHEIYGISEKKENLGRKILGITINTTDDDMEDLFNAGVKNAIIAIGSIGNPHARIKLFEKVVDIGFDSPSIISPDSVIAEDVIIKKGTVVMPGAIINAGTVIGNNCIINTGAIIDHDCVINDNVHIAPGVTLSGGVSVGHNSHVGTGANVIQGVCIGNNVLVGAGTLILNDIEDDMKAIGVPAKSIPRK